MAIYFTIYVRKKSIKMLSLLYHELIGQVEEHEEKKTLDKIENITSIEELDDTEILINTDNKLPDDITMKMF